MNGEGIIDDFRKKINSKLDSRPKAINSFLKKNSKKAVIQIDVCRRPVNSIIRKILNFLSNGHLEEALRKYDYDQIYHLYMNITLSDGSKYSLEKNQRVKVKRGGIKPNSNTECRTVSNLNIPVQRFITNGEKSGVNFYRYSTVNNCQRFINDLLTRNGIKKLTSFVKQNAKELLNPFTKKVAQAVTDVAGVVDIGLSGGNKNKIEVWIKV